MDAGLLDPRKAFILALLCCNKVVGDLRLFWYIAQLIMAGLRHSR